MTTEQRPTPVLFGDGIEQEKRQQHVRINAMSCEIMGATLFGIVSDLSLGRIASRNAMQIQLHSICIPDEIGRLFNNSTAQDVLKEHSAISRISDTSVSQHNYRVRPSNGPHPSSINSQRNRMGEGCIQSLFLQSDISPMCQFPPRTRASHDSQQKRNAQRTLPAASRRARVPPRTRIVGAF